MKIVKTFMNLSVMWKFLLAFYSILIIPAIFLGVYLYDQTTNTVISQAQMVMEQNLYQTRAGILQNVKIIENISQIVAFDTKLQSFLDSKFYEEVNRVEDYKENIIPFVESILRQNRVVKSLKIYMADPSIPEIYDTFYNISRVNNQSWFTEIWENQSVKSMWRSCHQEPTFIVSPAVVSKAQVFSYNCKVIPTSSNEPIGILEIDIKEEILFNMLRGTAIRNFGKVFIVDSNGKVVSNNIPELFMKEVGYTGISKSLIEDGLNHVEKVNGIDSIVISIPIEEVKCYIVGVFPTQLFNDKSRKTIITIILVMAAASLIMGIFIYLVTNVLLSRVKRLAKTMRQVREGNLDISLPVNSKDEFGDLTVSFNHMTARIHELIETVYKIQILEKEAELKVLEAQINPHFLYNTLATIAWSGRMANAPKVVEISNTLARFYRLVLSKGKTLIPVEEELEMVKAYLSIQKVRFSSGFDYIYQVDENLLQYYMMKNILQPIVENALNHGIQPKRGHGTIIIRAEENESSLVFQIIDDGVGVDVKTLGDILEGKVERSRESGYAIKNVMERLKAFYGNQFTFDMFSRVGIGTTVKIMIEKRIL